MGRRLQVLFTCAAVAAACALWLVSGAPRATATRSNQTFSEAFQRKILEMAPEAPFELRFFETAVKTDSRGRIITGPTSDPVKNIVGAEPAGKRAGLDRFTKIMYGAGYIDGRPDPGTRIDPNNPQVKSGNQFWPYRKQPFRSQPRALALSQDGRKLYVTLPGREGYPDWRVAVVDTNSRQVSKWIDLRPAGESRGLRPIGVKAAPLNTAISASPYVVVLNQYANFASVIDATTDAVSGEFETGFYGEKLVFNKTGTRLYITDRYKDAVRAFRIDPGPRFTQIAVIPTGESVLERTNPRDLDISADGRTLYVANTLGHTIAAINIDGDANALAKVLPVGGLSTDVKIAGRWGIVAGQETNTRLNERETGHGLPTKTADGTAIRNNGQPLGYTPVMSDATKATTFDDIGSEINVFDTTTNRFVFRYVDEGRDVSQLVTPGQFVDIGDHAAAQKIIRGSGPEQIFVRGDKLFVTYAHSEQVQAFRINAGASDPSQVLTPLGVQFTGGVTPQGVEVSPDGKTVYVANFQTEDVSFLNVDPNGNLTRQGFTPVGVTPSTPDPTTGGRGQNLFATDEEVGLRWFFSSAYSDDGQKSCGFCHWDGRQDGCQWNVAANAVGGTKVCPQNKDISDNWPEWYEGLNNDLMAYASACNGEVLLGERNPTPLFPQPNAVDRFKAREEFVLRKTEENSRAIGRGDLSGKAQKVGYYDLAYLQILWSQNEVRRLPSPSGQFPEADAEAAQIARGKDIFTKSAEQGGAGCAECHHNGNKITNGALDDTFQDFNIHEPGVISESTVDGDGPFFRPETDYFFTRFGPPQDVGTPQNFSSRNTKHLRAFWDGVPRYLHHGFAHTVREILLAPDSPLLRPGERGFNFRTVRTDHRRGANNLPTEVPITVADRTGALAGDGFGQILVSLDSPHVVQNGKPQIDRLGTNNLAPVVAGGQINPALTANNVRVIKDTHGKTSQLSAEDLDALEAYLKSLSMSRQLNSNSGSGDGGGSGSGSGGTGSGGTTSVAKAQFTLTDVRVEEGAGAASVEVARTGDTTKEAAVDYLTTDVSASDRTDYALARGTLRFAPGETSKRITVLLTDDATPESDEQINLSLANPGDGCTIGEAASMLITVADNDAAASNANPADDPAFFVREHYHDFLNREPDAPGLAFWSNNIQGCNSDAGCAEVRRINTSAAFFLSIEFQQTGYLVERMYRAAYGRRPAMVEFMPDAQEASRELVVGAQGWEGKLEANKRAFAEAFAARAGFRQSFDALSNAQLVDKLYANAGVAPSQAERDELVRGLDAGALTRGAALRRVAENAELSRKEFNAAFVLMQYFGYLRRDPDEPGFNFWLSKLEQFGGDFQKAEMVKAFISSEEYRQRFRQ
ncbi:MAG TPA: beta-propeller fold lactonase family protein [Pyrinomonadaceae bacterium]|nr:beta-propeller fold lactonase family protein [Pyrinomonadaceae bacterium]